MAWLKQWQVDIAKEQLKDEQEILRILKEATTDAQESVLEKYKKLMDRLRNEPDNITSNLYQAKFQKQLQNQIDPILSKLNNKQFASVKEFLKESYEDGIISTCYSLQQQGIPIILPIDQNEAILMASKTADGFKLSTKLHKDIIKTATAVRNEITRGIVSSLSYDEVARNISNRLNMNYNSAVRIARTEGHKVTMQSKIQAMAKAKNKGADIVKQWDSTLDGRTRPHHRELDGQVRELDGQFSVAGHKASYPGGFGIASEDINCRCAMLEVPRWALDGSDDVTKWDNESGKLLMNQKEINQWKKNNGFPITANYNKFKKVYKKKMAQQSTTTQKSDPNEELLEKAKNAYKNNDFELYNQYMNEYFGLDKYKDVNYSEKEMKDKLAELFQDSEVFKGKTYDEFMHAYKSYVGTPKSFKMNNMLRKDGQSAALKWFDSDELKFYNFTKECKIGENMNAYRFVDNDAIEYYFNKAGSSSPFLIYLPDDVDSCKKIIDKMNDTFQDMIFKDEAFTSASFDTNKNVFKSRPYLMKLHVPENTKGIMTDNFMESEIVIAPGMQIQFKYASLDKVKIDRWGREETIEKICLHFEVINE